jgi:hypothetical protein
MTARLVTSTTPFEWVDGNDRVTWTVEPPGVVSVDRQGRATPVSIGIAIVVATLGDQRGTNRVRVLPDYAGTWSGTYRITGCSGHYDFRTCGRMMFNQLDGSQNGYPFTLVLAQFRDQVTGTLDERNRSIPLAGIVRESGVLVLEATFAQPDLDPLRITNWASTTNAGNTLLSGAFTKFEPGRIGTTPYTVRTENEFGSVPRAQ